MDGNVMTGCGSCVVSYDAGNDDDNSGVGAGESGEWTYVDGAVDVSKCGAAEVALASG